MEPAGLLMFSVVGAFTDHKISGLKSLSSRRLGFDSRPAHVGFVVEKNCCGTAFVRVLQIAPVNIMSPTFHNHLSITGVE